ncbi:hypothetical protein PFLUV_G00030240 [Perca fluviatilis]|uniref:PHR domain-containing protein n=1 Tax=Perca fluviatilis TaxID=8168 RepID=A0A6A5ESZ7_PERFL|nr:hypothetical protein PFLUV_G00030240 [Perca fluviatilis]
MFLLCPYNSNHRNQLDILSCATGPAQSGILFDREVVNLFLHFTVNPKPRVDYIDRPRCCLRGEECSINRFQQVESRWGYSGTSDRIRFNVNRRICIVGFGLYGSIHGPNDYQVNIQILESDKRITLGQNDTGFNCDGTANTFRVMFKEPVEILPSVSYTACATLKGPDSHYGTKGLKKWKMGRYQRSSTTPRLNTVSCRKLPVQELILHEGN